MSRRPRLKIRPIIAGKIFTGEGTVQMAEGIRSDHITDALDKARTHEFADDFRKNELEWAEVHLSPLTIIARRIIELTEARTTRDTAQAALTGALLGGTVIRNITNEGLVTLQSCRMNLIESGALEGGIVYDGRDIDYDAFAKILGSDAADGLDQIRHNASRTMCGTIIGLCLIPVE